MTVMEIYYVWIRNKMVHSPPLTHKTLTPPPAPTPPPPVVCSTERSKAVVPVLVLLFVALWFILRGDLLYVVPCVILFLCFSVLLVLRLPRLGKRELILVLFVRLFGLCLFGFVGFLFLLGSGKGCGLWLWHSLDFSLTFLMMSKFEHQQIANFF